MSGREYEIDHKNQEELYRFIQDLEFIQCLANPSYLQYLADNNYFKENEFINYISYLQYFKRIEYLKFITYSRSIIFLDLLQYDFFRDALGDPNFIQFLIQKVEEEWLEKKPIEKDFVMNNLTTVNGVSNLENDMNKMDISN